MSSTASGRLKGSVWRRTAARVRKQEAPCHLCGKPIDYTLPASDPNSFTVDHLVPRSHGGSRDDPANLAAAHRGCNSRRGTRTVESARPAPRSRDW